MKQGIILDKVDVIKPVIAKQKILFNIILSKGLEIDVLGKRKNFYLIRCDDVFGWVPENKIKINV